MIRRLDVKIILLLIAIAVVIMGAAMVLVSEAVRISVGLGLNRDVQRAIDRTAPAIREQVRSQKITQRIFLERLMDSTLLTEACLLQDSDRIHNAFQKAWRGDLDLLLIQVSLRDGGTVRFPETMDDSRHAGYRLIERRAPLFAGACEELIVSFGVDPTLTDQFEQAALSAQTYTTLYDAPRDWIVRRVRIVFGILLGVVVMLAIWQGVYLTRRMARRIHTLSLATHAVAEGDLSVQLDTGARDEVGDLIASFNAMVEEMKETRNRIAYLQKIGAWQEIARRLAHEIKNPLTPIHLAAQQLKDSYAKQDPAFDKLFGLSIDIIEEEVATLRRLVSDFSEFARLPGVSREPTDLAAFLRECQTSLSWMADQYNVTIHWEIPNETIPVTLDGMMMKRVLDNLLRNAAGALTDAGSESPVIRISAAIETIRDRRDAVLRVADNGPGLLPEHHISIFEPYYTTREDGTGLGLAIAKKIVLEHDGVIRAEETPREGACFVIQLPLQATGPRRRSDKRRSS